MTLTNMDWVREVLDQAKRENLSLDDIRRMAEWADSPQEWDRAVNELIRATNG